MVVLGVILARAGSKGLPDKCVRALLGRPVIAYTFDHVLASRRLTAAVLTTDSQPAAALARAAGIEVIERPAELATDSATVDAAVRHAVDCWEHRHRASVDVVVILYGNVPLRAAGLIDRAVAQREQSGADSVRSVAPVTKQHPDWIHRLDGDRMFQFRTNSIYRRQDLEPLYYHDGAVIVVARTALLGALRTPDDHQAFLGTDRRALVQDAGACVDIDEMADLCLAEALLRSQAERAGDAPAPARAGGVMIGPNRVAPGARTLVVAEAGVNHDGSVERALALVDAAVQVGADAVKFQMFRADELVTPLAPAAAYQKDACGAVGQREMLAGLELSPADFHHIRRHCAKRGILFLATPFSPSDAARLAELGAAAIKLASTDLTNRPLQSAAAATGLPLIVSTGASTPPEQTAAVAYLRSLGAGDRLVLLHCVSAYPAPLDALNLRAIAVLTDRFGVPCGFSDHAESTGSGAWAVAAGACALEKHLTLDRTLPGPDHAMSLTPTEFAEYVSAVRHAEAALGTGIPGLHAAEAEVRRVARRSVAAAQRIPAGCVLAAEHLTLKRPGTGLPPEALEGLIGRRARREIPTDTLLTWDMVT
ncbi:MAG: N-acetylneuraminate synthase family protein [Planctomycetes bacterium]|nr:N-acetylneuraminate synthase family protein [Planctomycetota bacterium]